MCLNQMSAEKYSLDFTIILLCETWDSVVTKALGGGNLLKTSSYQVFYLILFGESEQLNMRMDQKFRSESETKGELFIVGKGKSEIAYQFIERNFETGHPLQKKLKFVVAYR